MDELLELSPASNADRPTTLHEAMDSYAAWVTGEQCHRNSRSLSAIRCVQALKRHFSDRLLRSIDDPASIDRLFEYLGNRPNTTAGSRMSRSYCLKLIHELQRFLNWLDLSDISPWRMPLILRRHNAKVVRLATDLEALQKRRFVFSGEELRLLYNYAKPAERLFVLLGLNCAFGAAHIGDLRIGEVHLTGTMPMIHRIERRKGTSTMHFLWKQTHLLLQSAIKERTSIATGDPDEVLFVDKNGSSLRSQTAAGYRANGIGKYWHSLMNRVRADHPDFPNVGFNSLRRSSISLVQGIAGSEIASIHAMHSTRSSSEHLHYRETPWKAVFAAQRQLESQLATMFEAIPDPASESNGE